MAKTRASKASSKAAPGAEEVPKATAPKVQLEPESANPPQLFILPKDISKEARIVTLHNPRYLTEDRYVVCPEKGFYEFTKVSAPKATPRSWLLTHDSSSMRNNADDGSKEKKKKAAEPTGYITREASLCIATPIDPLFIVLSALAPKPTSKTTESPNKLFLSAYDYFERITAISSQFGAFSRTESIRQMLEKRMAAVCDTVEAGDESMYRLDDEKLLGELLKKAKKMTEKGLPPSMEEKFVRKALESPVLNIKLDDSAAIESAKAEEKENETGNSTPTAETPDTQSTEATDSATSSFSISTAATSFSEEQTKTPLEEKEIVIPAIVAPEGVADLLRLRTALFYICSAYLASHVSESIKKLISAGTKTVDFTPLDTHLTHLTKLRQEALASRSLGDYSRKRNMFDEDDDNEERAAKKRKKEEEEKRKKAGESRGVKNLKKVNVSGMKKMSDFFKKKV